MAFETRAAKRTVEVVYESLAQLLRQDTAFAWDAPANEASPHFTSEDDVLLLRGSPINDRVRRIGIAAHTIGGLRGQQRVVALAFMEIDLIGEPQARDRMSEWALFELNWAWAGIGDWSC